MLPTNPVAELNNLCARNALRLTYEFDLGADLAQTTCRLNVAARSPEASLYFEGMGPSKKVAKRNASQSALDSLRSTLSVEATDELSLGETISKLLESEKLRKDPIIRCYIYMAMKLCNGWIPLGIVLSAKGMKRWCNREGQQQALTLAATAPQITDDCDQLLVSDGGLLIQPTIAIEFPEEMDLQIYGNASERDSWEAVLLPADSTKPPLCVNMEAETGLLENVLEHLQADIHYLRLVNTIRGKAVSVPSMRNVDLETDHAITILETCMRDLGSKTIAPEEIKAPSLWYHDYPQAEKNVRASWLCGSSIHGDALLTLARPSGNGKDPMTMNWRDYSLFKFWYSVSVTMPETVHASHLSLPVMGRLPSVFDKDVGWQGHLPTHLLQTYMQMTGRSLQVSDDVSQDEVFTCEMHVSGTSLSVTEKGTIKEATEQNAALRMIRLLQNADFLLWYPERENRLRVCHRVDSIVTVNQGHPHKPVAIAGSWAKVQYRLLAWSDVHASWFLVESSDSYVLEVSNASALGEALNGLHVDGVSRVQFLGRFGGYEEESPSQKFCAFVHLLAVVGCPNRVKLFEPPLSQQRFSAVAQELLEHNCRNVLDIGCGEGRFLECLMSTEEEFELLQGVDISGSALKRASARLPLVQTKQSVKPTVLQADIFNGSLLGWSHQVDAAVMIEVIEHMDPVPLNQVGKTVLGIIRPRLFVATTPNWEYNCVLYHRGGAPPTPVSGRDGNPLRCSDHRFEWTRQEFEAWAGQLAAEFGYSVKFRGIGTMLDEACALAELGLTDVNLGHSTQMAVFFL